MDTEQNTLLALFPPQESDAPASYPVERVENRDPINAISYFIFITPRSGSTFLTHLLSNHNLFGRPDEWFNPESIGHFIKDNNLNNIYDYINFIVDSKKTKNNVFGCEFSWPQFDNLYKCIDFEGTFGKQNRWFFLRRRNVVAQAISLVIALQTGIFHSYQVNNKDDGAEAYYDRGKIKNSVKLIIDHENAILKKCSDMSVYPIELYYEDLISDPEAAVKLFRNVMRTHLYISSSDVCNPIKKIGSERNVEYETTFRSEESEFLEELKARRPRILIPSQDL